MRTRTAATVLAAAALLAVPACGDDTADPPHRLDGPGQRACDLFAHGYKETGTVDARSKLAARVREAAKTSAVESVRNMSGTLVQGATNDAQTWQMGADAFAKACLDEGWTAG
ncbi:hypothetical protein ACIP98_14125 [Streptomyces sp. NPDC088354]|uniref:hypothetical protein n=1 Tax=unclassified Streptomyces TaxID=2593676 RepID=UPI0029A5783E|nr:hypothetical protein [Streptomyces sp. MI02-7b]MDX3071008.1 hypothetical protein [Streptomyces sp. MI02-7b]